MIRTVYSRIALGFYAALGVAGGLVAGYVAIWLHAHNVPRWAAMTSGLMCMGVFFVVPAFILANVAMFRIRRRYYYREVSGD